MLKIRKFPVFQSNTPFVYISKDCQIFPVKREDSGLKVMVQTDSTSFYGELCLVEESEMLSFDELGIGNPLFETLSLKEGQEVSLFYAETPTSLDILKTKISGDILSPQDQKQILKDISTNHYSCAEIASFLVANSSFYSPQEVLSLTENLIETFTPLAFNAHEKRIVDDFSIGGVLGNRVGLIVQAILMSAGYCVPKVLPHTVNSCSGTLDVMHVFSRIHLSKREIEKSISSLGGCLASSSFPFVFSKTDETIIQTERLLGLTTFPQLVASVMARKKVLGVSSLVIDIPVGEHCKVSLLSEAVQLKKLFEYVGKSLDIKTNVVLTDGTEPIGLGIGPFFEAQDVLKVLKNAKEAPVDLKEKSLFLAARLFDMQEDIKAGEGLEKATALLSSGKAYEIFNTLTYMQGQKALNFSKASFSFDAVAPKAGLIKKIDSAYLRKIAKEAGAPYKPTSGLKLNKKTGDCVEKGETLYQVYTSSASAYSYLKRLMEGSLGYEILEN